MIHEPYPFSKESESDCLDVSYAHYLHYLGETDWETHEIDAGRQWTWQTCTGIAYESVSRAMHTFHTYFRSKYNYVDFFTEFGYYQTTDSNLQPFGNHFGLRFSLNDCKKTFGEGYSDDILSKRIEETNINYGEDDIKVKMV